MKKRNCILSALGFLLAMAASSWGQGLPSDWQRQTFWLIEAEIPDYFSMAKARN